MVAKNKTTDPDAAAQEAGRSIVLLAVRQCTGHDRQCTFLSGVLIGFVQGTLAVKGVDATDENHAMSGEIATAMAQVLADRISAMNAKSTGEHN